MKVTFWLSIFIVFYTFLGYGILLFLLVRIKRLFSKQNKKTIFEIDQLPTCTLIVAAFNEEDYMHEKIKNTLQLKYPADKLQILFVTDGSSDRTPEIVSQYKEIKLLHSPVRKGKINAVHRAVQEVNTAIIVFTDANTFLNEDALQIICSHYQDRNVGAVAGEKRVFSDKLADASAAGEGFYWKYESALKKWDSELYSVVGAAGELFSIRTALYEPVGPDIILDDFMISMLIAMKNYKIVYEPNAYATENASANVKEELKRKVRIAAGGIQSIMKLLPLFNIFKYRTLSFQYISHRVLRWTVSPFLLIFILILNAALVFSGSGWIYTLLLFIQFIFYSAAYLGYVLEKQQLRIKALFIPYYFCIMNYAVIAGIQRYYKNQQSATWEKSLRKQ